MQSVSLVRSLNSLLPSFTSTLHSSRRFQPLFRTIITSSSSSHLPRNPFQCDRSAPATLRSPRDLSPFGMLCTNSTNYFHCCLCWFFVVFWTLWSSIFNTNCTSLSKKSETGNMRDGWFSNRISMTFYWYCSVLSFIAPSLISVLSLSITWESVLCFCVWLYWVYI